MASRAEPASPDLALKAQRVATAGFEIADAIGSTARLAPQARMDANRLLIAAPTDDHDERRLLVERLLLALAG